MSGCKTVSVAPAGIKISAAVNDPITPFSSWMMVRVSVGDAPLVALLRLHEKPPTDISRFNLLWDAGRETSLMLTIPPDLMICNSIGIGIGIGILIGDHPNRAYGTETCGVFATVYIDVVDDPCCNLGNGHLGIAIV